MLNTLPFPSTDFGNQDVRREIAAQDLRLLSPYTDRFELMTYLQILNRPVSWLRTAIEDARAELDNSGSEVVCTLQGDALYTEGIHGSRMRSPTVTADEIFAGGNSRPGCGSVTAWSSTTGPIFWPMRLPVGASAKPCGRLPDA